MIEVGRPDGGIMVKGHAHYAENGKDIVCAGISALVQTLIRSMQELTEDPIQYRLEPGMVTITYGNLSEGACLLVNSFFLGAFMIAGEYPDYVKLV